MAESETRNRTNAAWRRTPAGVKETADRMEARYGKDAHVHAAYNVMNNHGKNDKAHAFWTAVCDELKARPQ